MFLTALLLLRTLLVPAVFIDFQLRKDFIAQHLCENRMRPELHCNGKCYLAKKLKAVRETEEREAGTRLLNQLLELPHLQISERLSFGMVVLADAERASSAFLPDFYHFVRAGSCFRPPQLCL